MAWCDADAGVATALDGHAPVSRRSTPNALWCADYKGEFLLADRRYCYPLTITDFASRYLFALRGAGDDQKTLRVHACLSASFRSAVSRGAIRTDNGLPFGSAQALYGFSKLQCGGSGGIQLERITPGHPEQNGRHERMHLTLKTELTKPAAANSCSNRRASMTSWSAITTTARTRRSP